MYIEDRLKALEVQNANLHKALEELSGKLDNSVERWTWDRYQRIEKNLLPQIGKMIEKWTWERYERGWNDLDLVLGKLDKLLDSRGSEEFHSFDVIVPIGKACRPAKLLSDNRLRKAAYPLDWMMEYKIGTVSHLLETNFEDFFTDCVEDEKATDKLHENPSHIDKRYVIDNKNHITSIHHFFMKNSIEEGKRYFLIKMKRRAEIVMDRLRNAEKILFLGNRDESREELKNFLSTTQDVCFSNADITLINIRHDESMQKDAPVKIYNESEGRLHFYEYVFNDTNKNGGADYWLGDTDRWNEILKNIRLTDRFTDENTKSLRSFVDA